MSWLSIPRPRPLVAAIAPLLVFGLAAAAAAQPIFPTRTEYSEKHGPYAVELVDIDGDGDQDVLSAIYDANYLSVRRNDGSGALAEGEFYEVGWVCAIATGDVTGDGRPDVAVADFQNHVVRILHNQAGGHLIPGQTLNFAGLNPRDLTLADLDGDGDRDLAVACVGNGTVITYANSGSGVFTNPIVLSAGSQPKAIESADLDADGRIDLVVNIYGSNRVRVFRNVGGRAFTSKLYVTGTGPSGLVLGDVNADGRPDIAVSNEDQTASVLLNLGGADFSLATSYGIGHLSQSTVLADMDGNGSPDLVVSNYTNGTVTLRFNSGTGTFPAEQTVDVGSFPRGAVAGDLNDDGRQDLVVGNYIYPSSEISVLLSGPVSAECVLRTFDAGASPSQAVAAKLDADEDVDLASVNEDGTLDVLLNQGGGQFAPPVAYAIGGLAQSIAAADFDGDGAIDLVAANFTESSVSVLLNRGDGTFDNAVAFAVGPHPRFVTVADLDGDDAPDIITANYNDAIALGTFTVLSNRGGGNFSRAADVKTGIGPYMVAAADLNDDGRIDVVVNNYDENTVTVHRNLGGNRFALANRYAVGWGTWTAIGDLDGDLRPDLAVANFQDASVSVLRNLGGATFGGRTDFPTLAGTRAIEIVDADADGVLDLAVIGSLVQALRIHRNAGGGTFTTLRTCVTRGVPKAITVAPVDDQPGNEIVISDYTAGSISLVDAGAELAVADPIRRSLRGGTAAAALLPATLALSPAQPNPVSDGAVTFVARLPEDVPVDARIYDASGRETRTLFLGPLPAGEHILTWDGTSATGSRARAGVYFLRLRAGTAVFNRKVVLLGRS